MNRLNQAWYWPDQDDEQILRINDRKPCKAEVLHAEDGFCDLKVTDHFGSSFIRLHVPTKVRGGDYCSMVA